MKVHQLQEDLVKYAASIGVDKIGFTTAAPFHELKNRLRRQQQLAYQSGFEEANIELRTEPLKLLDEAESIIAIAIAYPSRMQDAPQGKKGSVAASFAVLHGGLIIIQQFVNVCSLLKLGCKNGYRM